MKTTPYFGAIAVTFAVFFVSACSNIDTASTVAQADGLALVPHSKFDQFYRNSDTDFSKFSQISIEPCEVSFRKNWQRDQNASRPQLASRVTDEDVNRMKGRLGDACDDKFRESLELSAAYKLVDNYNTGESVLVLRPTIVDLDVSAPDVRGAGFNRSFTMSSGQMTLSVDMVAGSSGEVLARVIDRRRDHEDINMQLTSSVTNQVDAHRALSRWAQMLRESLDELKL